MKIISLLIMLILISSVYALTEEERFGLLDTLDKFKDDPVSTDLVLQLLNNAVDISDDPELVKAVEDAAIMHNINIDEKYPNIRAGIPEDHPVVVPQAQTQPETTEPIEPTTPVAPQQDFTAPILIVAAIAIGIITYWWSKKKKITTSKK